MDMIGSCGVPIRRLPRSHFLEPKKRLRKKSKYIRHRSAKVIEQTFRFPNECAIFLRLHRARLGGYCARSAEVTVLFEDIPAGISLEDNELGSRSSLQKLATYVE